MLRLDSVAPWPLVALCACGNPQPAAIDRIQIAPQVIEMQSDPTEVPASFVDDLPLVQVTFGDEAPAWFLVDTGWGLCTIDRDHADSVGLVPLRYLPGIEVTTATGAVESFEEVVLAEQMQLGTVVIHTLHLLLTDLDDFSAGLHVPVRGIIGWPILRALTTTIDYPMEKIEFGTQPIAPDAPHQTTLRPEAGSPVIELTIQGQARPLILDTGSSETLAVPGDPEHYEWATPPRAVAKVNTLAGMSGRNEFGRLAGEVDLAGHSLRAPIVMQSQSVGRIGGGTLCHFRVSIDGTNNRLLLSRADDAPIEAPPWRSTGVAIWRRDSGLVVVDVTPDSPAERAGLVAGDSVVWQGETPDPDFGPWPEVAQDFDGLFIAIERSDGVQRLAVARSVLIP